MDKNFIDIVDSFCPHGELLSAEILPGGYSSDVYILNVKVDEKEVRFVLRSEGSPRSENTINTEFQLIQSLAEQNLPIPEAVFCDTSLCHFHKPFMIMSFIEGKVQEPTPKDSDWLDKFASLLQDVRSIDTSLLPKLPVRIDPLEDIFKFIPKDDEWNDLKNFLCNISDTVYKGDKTFLHGDFWPGNILWKGKEIVGLLDWEYAAIGDPVSDIAVASLELRYSLGEEGMTKFQEQCSNFLDIDPFRLSLWMIYVASSTLTYIKEWRLPEDREVIMIREAKQTIRDAFRKLYRNDF